MRNAWIIAAAALAASTHGCSSGDEIAPTDIGYTTGGEGKPVGPSRVAAPLDEAGPRVNYPDFDQLDIVPDRSDPMMAEGSAVPAGDCPATLAGVDIDVTDIYDGAAIVVTGELGEAATIQASARHMVETAAASDDAALAETRAPEADLEGVGKPEDATVAMPGARTEVVDLARGARISYFAEDPDDVVELRNAVRRLAAAMQAGTCPAF